MIAVSEPAVVAIVIAIISAIASVIGGYFAYKAAVRTKTGNGHTLGQIVDQMAERLARVEIWTHEHLRDHANRES